MTQPYVRLEDVLALLPDRTDFGYKSAHLREKVKGLPVIFLEEDKHVIWQAVKEEEEK